MATPIARRLAAALAAAALTASAAPFDFDCPHSNVNPANAVGWG